MLECLPVAEELGYSSALFASHHAQPDGWCPSPLVALGAAAAVTERMRLGTAVLLVPLYAPAKLAEDVAVLDNLSGGRLILGVAPGYVSEEFAAHGVPRDERVPRMEEALDLMIAAWTQDTASFEGASTGCPRRRSGPSLYSNRIRRSGTGSPVRSRCAGRPRAAQCSSPRRGTGSPSYGTTTGSTRRPPPRPASQSRSVR